MSHNNYRNYNNYHNQNSQTNQINRNNYNDDVQKTAVSNAEFVKPVVVESEVVEVVEEPKPVFGIVSGCAKLNIRNAPSLNGNVICTVNENTKLMLILEESTAEWYKVCNSAGLNGFCMKKYVTVKE